ncbi:hypothetical protein, partial [Lactiplantibacillus pentosus]|uniref:hypothetical protein n=1 Tax=Lactiplantibacillus pentosus TaxID=1589 RepID=UPI001CDB1E2B
KGVNKWDEKPKFGFSSHLLIQRLVMSQPPFCHIQLAQKISGRPSFEYSSGFQFLSLGHFNGSPF